MRTTWLLLLGLHSTLGNSHHGGLHAEHRMTEFSKPMPPTEVEAVEASNRISRGHSGVESGGSSGWPDSHSLWADIPTSQSFHKQVLHTWKPQQPLSLTAKQTSDDVFFDRKRHAHRPPPTPELRYHSNIT